MTMEAKSSRHFSNLFLLSLIFFFITISLPAADNAGRTMKYSSRSATDAVIWQKELRSELSSLLKIDDLLAIKKSIPLNPEVIFSEDKGTYRLEEVEFNSTASRRIRVLLTIPSKSKGLSPAVICIHGHVGKIGSVYEPKSIYKGFATELAAGNYVTIAPVVSQHEIYEKDRMLMGERLWDLIRCVDYLESLSMVNKNLIGCAGLSLGGEMAMWLGAMDTRIKATVSSGFLTNMDQMEQNHCMCWKFNGLRDLVDWTDVYSLIAPRYLQCQNGMKEPPADFTVPLAKEAMNEIKVIYGDFMKPENVSLDVHEGAHEIDLPSLLNFFDKYLVPNI
jgi:dienelactone hydrolase